MLKFWVAILNFLSALEFKIADILGEPVAIGFHFFLFWIIPIVFLYIPAKFFIVISILIAMFYVYVLLGDIFLSVFGHEKLEKNRGMVDITNVHEMRAEIIGALKYIGGIVSFATVFNGLQKIFDGGAFIISHPSPFPYFDCWNSRLYYRASETIENPEKKIEAFERARRFYPFNDLVFYELGKAYFDLGIQNLEDRNLSVTYLQKSIQNFTCSLRFNPASYFCHFSLA